VTPSLSRSSVTERLENRVDACLVARPLRLEPLDDILIDAQRDQLFTRQRMQPTPHDAANDMLWIKLGVLRTWLAALRWVGQTVPISLRLA
jgi:hypothetical protein